MSAKMIVMKLERQARQHQLIHDDVNGNRIFKMMPPAAAARGERDEDDDQVKCRRTIFLLGDPFMV